MSKQRGERFFACVISLRDANPRRVDLHERFAPIKSDFEIFDAIDGRVHLPAEMEAEVDRCAWLRRYARPATDAELACALSHREAYRRFLETNASYALILEDDALVDDRLAAFVAMQGYRVGPIVLLDYGTAYVRRRRVAAISGTASEAFHLSVSPDRATGYTLNREMAERFIKAQSPVSRIADFPLDLADQGGVAVVPRIVGSPKDERLSMIGARPRATLALRLKRLGPLHVMGRRLIKEWRKINAIRVAKEKFRRR